MVEYRNCKTDSCEKKVKEPYFYCFDCNKARKEGKTESVKPKEETVYDAPKGFNSEGPEFGLACNLALRYTLDMDKTNEDTFESLYRKNVKFFHNCNKELRKEILK